MMLHSETVKLTRESIAAVLAALRRALTGGPTFLPLPDTALAGRLLAAARPDDSLAGVALLVPTSGSTGTPKLVELTPAALLASATATHGALGGPGQWLLATSPTHIAGVQVLVRSIVAGSDPVVLESDSFRPEPFVAATRALTGPRRYTALVPTQLGRLLADPAATAALTSYHAVLVGGAATPTAVLRAALAAGVAVRTTYGMSETAGGCVYDGVPLPGVGISIDDTGRIRLSGPTLARGYRGEPELTAAALVAGQFLTADAGRIDHGRLTVLGRLDDVMNTGGQKVYPGAVEAVLRRQPGVHDVVVAGVPDPEWGQAVTAWVVGHADAPALREAVRGELGPAAVPKTIYRLAAIPLLGSGKPDRRGLVHQAGNPAGSDQFRPA